MNSLYNVWPTVFTCSQQPRFIKTLNAIPKLEIHDFDRNELSGNLSSCYDSTFKRELQWRRYKNVWKGSLYLKTSESKYCKICCILKDDIAWSINQDIVNCDDTRCSFRRICNNFALNIPDIILILECKRLSDCLLLFIEIYIAMTGKCNEEVT